MARETSTDEIVFEVDGRTIKCRKSLLMLKSQYLRDYLTKNASSTRICISNVPYESCEVVMRWMHGNDSIASFIGEACSTPKLQKIWELSLRFAIVDVVAYCVDELKHRVQVENVCGVVSTLYRYPSVPENIKRLNEDLKDYCMAFIVKHQEEVQKTPAYFAVMGVNANIKADIEAALKGSMPPPLQHGSAKKGTAALLSKLREGGGASPSKHPPHSAMHPTHSSSPSPLQAYPQPASTLSTPVHRPHAMSVHHPSPLRDNVGASPRPPSVSRSDMNEPVYDDGPVFNNAPLADPPYDAHPLPEPDTSIPPRPSSTAGPPQTSTPLTQPSRQIPVTVTGAGRLKHVLGTAHGPARSGADMSPTPQPPVFARPSAAHDSACLTVEAAGEPLAPGTRLALCAEAHAQRKRLRDLMDDIDGGFLASFQLEDGKVDGPGFGVPLRFATGSFSGLPMRVVVREGGPTMPQPQALFHDRSAALDSTPGAHEVERAAPQQLGFDAERDSVLLKHYKLQQEVRVTSHELELFKNDFLDWETSLNQTNALRDVEEHKLRQRIMQQKRQLVNSMYGEMKALERDDSVFSSAGQREKEELETVLRDLRSRKDSQRVLRLQSEMEKVSNEIQKLENVRGLISTELAENEQYEGYSKGYVCAVKTAEHELSDILTHEDTTPGRMEELLESVAYEKTEHGREVSELEVRTRHLSKRIAAECGHIKHIRAFLDETGQVSLPSRLVASQ